MSSRLFLALPFGLALALGAMGCGSPCQDLGDRICNCEVEGQLRNNCKSNVSARVKASNATTSEQDYCEAKLATCPDPSGNIDRCAYILNTCPGRGACGLALPTPGGGDGCTTIDVPALQSLPDAL
jgi:hypothetical protein